MVGHYPEWGRGPIFDKGQKETPEGCSAWETCEPPEHSKAPRGKLKPGRGFRHPQRPEGVGTLATSDPVAFERNEK